MAISVTPLHLSQELPTMTGYCHVSLPEVFVYSFPLYLQTHTDFRFSRPNDCSSKSLPESNLAIMRFRAFMASIFTATYLFARSLLCE